MDLLWQYRYDLASGIWWTVKLTALSAALAFGMAIVAGLGRGAAHRILSIPAAIYIEVFRGTSALAQLFWLFYVLPYFGIDLSPTQCAVVGLGLCFGAYGAVIVRASVAAVPRAQLEAAAALNFSWYTTMKVVVLPEAFIMMMPLFSNLLIELIKATSLVSLITIPDLAFRAKSIIDKTYQAETVLGFTLLAYLALSLCASAGMRRIERKLAQGRVAI
jgi:polar amino acid transport system permease protein